MKARYGLLLLILLANLGADGKSNLNAPEPIALYAMAKWPMMLVDSEGYPFWPTETLTEYSEFKHRDLETAAQAPNSVDLYVFLKNELFQSVTADVVHIYDFFVGPCVSAEDADVTDYSKTVAGAKWQKAKMKKKAEKVNLPPLQITTVKLPPLDISKLEHDHLVRGNCLIWIKVTSRLECDQCNPEKTVSRTIEMPFVP